MILKVISLFTGSSQLLSKVLTGLMIVSTLAGGAGVIYSTIKAKGAAELQSTLDKANYKQLQKDTGDAIAKLNAQHAADLTAALTRRKAQEAWNSTAVATITDLQKDLADAKKTDICIDRIIPAARADRVRQLSKSAGDVSRSNN